MLGKPGDPQLLVTVNDNYDPKNFEFTVINGSWDGEFNNGHVTVLGVASGDYTDLGITEILTDNQDRLRCDFTNFGSYNEVFNNFHNPDYVAPQYKEVQRPICWDDDIPF
jgi:hypothetical protein